MAAIIGALRAVLSLDSAAFEAGLTSAQVGLRQFDQRMKSLGAGIAQVGAGLSLVGVGVAAAMKGAIDRADDFGDFAEKMGVGVEALSRMDYAAKIAGVNQDTLAKAMRRVAVEVDAAVSGNASAAAMFDQLGVSVRDAAGQIKPVDQVMTEMADHFAAMPDGAQKTALALQVFGKSGADMLLMMNRGSDGLRALSDEAESLGAVLTKEQTDSAGKFNETLDRLGSIGQNVATQLSAALLPTMQGVADAIASASKRFNEFSPGVKTALATIAGATVVIGPVLIGLGAVVASLGTIAGAVLAAASVIPGVLATVAAAFGGVTAAVAALTGGMGLLDAAIAASGIGLIVIGAGAAAYGLYTLSVKVGGVGTALSLLKDVAVEVFDRIGTAFALVPAAIEAGAAQMNASFTLRLAHMASAFVDFTQTVADGMNSIFGTDMVGLSQEGPADVARAALAMQDNADALAEKVNGMMSSISAPLKSVAAINAAMAKMALDVPEQITPATTALTDFSASLDEVADGAGGAMRRVSDAAGGAAQAVAQGMSEMGDTVREVFKGLIKGSMNASDALKRLSDKMADMAIDTLFSGIFGGGKGILGAVGGLLGFAKGGVFDRGRIAAFADGGVVSGATPYAMAGGLGVMGEAGPEAIMPLTRGPNGKLGVVAHGGSGGLHIGTIDARGAQEGVAGQIVDALRQFAQEFGPAVVEQSVAASRAAAGRGY